MAGTSAYPNALDNFAEASPTNLGDDDSTGRTHSERHDDMEAAMEAVQSTLGTAVAGGTATVRQRFEAIESLKANLAGPTFTGTVVLPSTTSIGNVSATELGYIDGVTSAIQTQLNAKAPSTGISPSAISGTAVVNSDARLTNARTPTTHASSHASGGSDAITLAQSQVTNLTTDLAAKAALASPTFTGTPAAPTAAVNTNTTQVATTAFVIAQAGTAVPIIEGTGAAGTATRFAREDHVHPTGGGGAGGVGLESVLLLMGA